MNTQQLDKEDSTRRTFAIISHPDAGKTTITEQLLLFGGVVRSAGTVKARKTGNFAKSDWMEIEQNVEFPLPVQSCSLIMVVSELIFWILLDMRISLKILIGL